jgi:FkbH-like protein
MSAEPVRLVIWDLDDTVWKGSLDEGGIQEYVPQNHEIIRELTRRGIINSICSKNDFIQAREVLEELGLWECFIFPSIDWNSKGARISSIIERMQLRPSTVFFIDDDPRNRAEAELQVPGLRTAHPECTMNLLDDPLFRGRSDSELKRLHQYKLLQRRAEDFEAFREEPIQFLRNSKIRVTIVHEFSANIDRAIELINRTNQLNFTKSRLPLDPDDAKTELAELLTRFSVQAGLVQVQDRYGDYGLCGLYLKEGTEQDQKLIHFCFSCRILGMGVEQWLYDKLGRPRLDGVSAASSAELTGGPIDWIEFSARPDNTPRTFVSGHHNFPQVRLQGGCDLDPIAHYFRLNGFQVLSRTNYVKGGQFLRFDTSSTLPLCLNATAIGANILENFGFAPADYDHQFLTQAPPGTVWLFSHWGDLYAHIYRNNQLGVDIPFEIRGLNEDLTAIPFVDLEKHFERDRFPKQDRARLAKTIRALGDGWNLLRGLDDATMTRNLEMMFRSLPAESRVLICLPLGLERLPDNRLVERPAAFRYGELVRRIAQAHKFVEVLDMAQYVRSPEDIHRGYDHYPRIVYLRFFEDVVARIRETPRLPQTGAPGPVAPAAHDALTR